jgi:UDP-N-acetylmuramoylalanine--D-glutamate ligase
MWNYNHKKVAIIGLSLEGVDCAKFFTSEHADVTCCDRRTSEDLGDAYVALQNLGVSFQLGKTYLRKLEKFDLIVRSPGVTLRTPELVDAKKHGIPITSQTKLMFDHCKGSIVGVTGTKGKGTISSLLYEILTNDGKHAWLGGNVGTPLLSKVHTMAPSDIVVLELSSFQLEDLHRSPHVALIQAITQDHLANFDPLASNYHLSREDYVEAKRSIVRYQSQHDIVVCNKDNETSVSVARASRARAYYFSRIDTTADAFVHEDAVYLAGQGKKQKIASVNDIQIRGIHNLENIAAASLAAHLCGARTASIQSAVRSFRGLPHRLEFVKTVCGVSYYDDAFSTTPETAIAAIRSFTEPKILILGGSEKGSDYTSLGREISGANIRALIIIGATAPRILTSVKTAGFSGTIVTGKQSMHDIVAACATHAREGDVVLLTPSCASFDMFKNYKERGNLFKHEVSLL